MNNMMLAQLMKDMQDPEIMREAQKLMQSPEFQAHMKKMTANPMFQQQMTAAKQAMQDPNKVKEMEAKMKTALEEGTKQLEEYEKKRDDALAKEGGEDGDKKKAAEDEVPAIPSLNIN